MMNREKILDMKAKMAERGNWQEVKRLNKMLEWHDK